MLKWRLLIKYISSKSAKSISTLQFRSNAQCILIVIGLIFTVTLKLIAANPTSGDFSKESHPPGNTHYKPMTNIIKEDTEAFSFAHPILLGAIKSYQVVISPSKGTYCPMYPSCSNYAFQAFEKYNPIKAFIVTSDRLHRCGHDLDRYETIVVNEYIRFVDLVENRPPSNLAQITLNDPIPMVVFEPNEIISDSDSVIKNIYGNESQIFNFADNLRAEGDFRGAITEFKRLISYYPQSKYSDVARVSLMNSYFYLGEYLEAAHTGQDIINRVDFTLDRNKVNYIIGDSYYKLGNFKLARKYLSGVVENKENLRHEKSLLLIGLTYVNEERWDDASQSFALINEKSPYFKKASNFRSLSAESINIRKKNSFTAGALAIVPGLGYLYNGYKQTAISAFLVNSLFFWATHEAFQRDNNSLGVMFGVLSFGWYSGNIYGSIISATRSNLKSKNDLLLKFEIEL